MTVVENVAAEADRANDEVMSFLYGLRRIPIVAWGSWSGGPADRTLHDRVRRSLARTPELDARIQRRVDHVLAACDGIAPSDVLSRMRAAACLAASALAARPVLTKDEFAQLYGVFATLVPLTDLESA